MAVENISAIASHDAPSEPETRSMTQVRHRLRTLLDQMIGYSEVLRTGDTGGISLECLADLEHVSDVARSLSRAVDRWSTQPSARYLHTFGIKLLEFAAHLDRVTAKISVPAQGDDLSASQDVVRLGSAVTGLRPLANELIANSSALSSKPQPQRVAEIRQSGTKPDAPDASQEESSGEQPLLLVVDDNEDNRELLSRRIQRDGYSVLMASGGQQALEMVRAHDFWLVLLDVMMPGVDGMAVLHEMKHDPALRDIPVIMISAVDEISSVAKCIEAGAEDYLPKPFDPVLLRARIRASLDRKRLRDLERRSTEELKIALVEVEKQRKLSDSLLLNTLPAPIAQELRERGAVDPMYFEDVSIGFTDFVGFTSSTERLAAEELVYILNKCFTKFDQVIERYGLEKLKTIGDSYMFAGGLPLRSPSHPVDMVMAASELLGVVSEIDAQSRVGWQVRIGIHTGPVIAGVVGIRKFAFDIWGETVNFASRMESSGAAGRINISERTYARIKDFFKCEHRGKVPIKDGRAFDMYFADSVQPLLREGPGPIPAGFQRRYRIYFKKDPLAFPASLLAAREEAETGGIARCEAARTGNP